MAKLRPKIYLQLSKPTYNIHNDWFALLVLLKVKKFHIKTKYKKQEEQLKFYFFDKIWICYGFLKCGGQLTQKNF